MAQVGGIGLQQRKPHERKEAKDKLTYGLAGAFENIRGMPKAKRGRAKAAMSTLNPNAEIIQAVTVVPGYWHP